MKTRVLFIFLLLSLVALLPAQVSQLRAQQTVPEISLNLTELVFAGTVNKTTMPTQVIKVKNTGNTNLQVTGITKTGASAFTLIAPPATPTTVLPNAELLIEVQFSPTSTINHGENFTGSVVISSDDADEPTRTVNLYGLSAEGIEGQNEPGLKNVLQTLGYKINNGWDGLVCGASADACDTPQGEEVLTPLFRRVGTANVTIKAVGRYSPDLNIPFGWYTPNGSSPTLHQVAVMADAVEESVQYPPNYNTLNPVIEGGGTTFNPGTGSFGIYVKGLQGRFTYTEDALNEGGPTTHAVRVYPLRNRSGQLVPNSFLLTFEDATNGDYQDYMFVLSNVVDANAPTPTNTFTKTPIPPTTVFTATSTAIPPTPTNGPTETSIPPTDEPTETFTASATYTDNPTTAPTETAEAIETTTAEASITFTATPEATSTNAADQTTTPDGIATASATFDVNATATETLTPTNTPDLSTGIEILVNGGFETSTTFADFADSWELKDGSSDRRKCNKDKTGDTIPDKIVANTGECAWMFKGDLGENSQIVQKPAPAQQAFAAGDTLALGAAFKAKPGVDASLRLTVKFIDPMLEKVKINAPIVPSDGYMPMLELRSLSGAPSLIKLRVQNRSQTGKLWVDDVSLLWVSAGSSLLLPLPLAAP